MNVKQNELKLQSSKPPKLDDPEQTLPELSDIAALHSRSRVLLEWYITAGAPTLALIRGAKGGSLESGRRGKTDELRCVLMQSSYIQLKGMIFEWGTCTWYHDKCCFTSITIESVAIMSYQSAAIIYYQRILAFKKVQRFCFVDEARTLKIIPFHRTRYKEAN